jgi:hypothetical protein
MYSELIERGAETLATNQRLSVETTALRGQLIGIMVRYRRHRIPVFSGASDIAEEPRIRLVLRGFVSRTETTTYGEAGTLADVVTEALVDELRGTRTDLAKLVRQVHRRRPGVIAVPANAIERWQNDAPGAWQRVYHWLMTRGVQVTHMP